MVRGDPQAKRTRLVAELQELQTECDRLEAKRRRLQEAVDELAARVDQPGEEEPRRNGDALVRPGSRGSVGGGVPSWLHHRLSPVGRPIHPHPPQLGRWRQLLTGVPEPLRGRDVLDVWQTQPALQTPEATMALFRVLDDRDAGDEVVWAVWRHARDTLGTADEDVVGVLILNLRSPDRSAAPSLPRRGPFVGLWRPLPSPLAAARPPPSSVVS